MAKELKMTAREADIAEQIRGLCSAIMGDTTEMANLREEIEELSDKVKNTRLAMCTEIAAMSSAGQWTAGEIKRASAHAAKMGNSTEGAGKTVGVFCSEIGVFAHPDVRDDFPTILTACQEAWANERQAVKDSDDPKSVPTPIKKYQSREYKLILQTTRAIRDGEVVITCVADVVAWAVRNDPDFDEEKVEKRLKSAAEMLRKIAVDFAHGDVGQAATFLEGIEAKDLMDSRNAMLAAKAKQTAKPLAPIPPVVAARVAAAKAVTPPPAPAAPKTPPTPPQAAPEPMVVEGSFPGAADLDNLLGDGETAELAAAA